MKTVGEVIAELERFPADLPVTGWESWGDERGYVNRIELDRDSRTGEVVVFVSVEA